MTLLHATTISVNNHALLILGESSVGKSGLALQLLDRGALLVSDDQTEISSDGEYLLASPPESIAGLMEVRGVGIVPFPHKSKVPVAAAITLVDQADEPRLPEPETIDVCGAAVPHLQLDAGSHILPEKVLLVMERVCGQNDLLNQKGTWGI